ncbi:MAG: 2Fe-2S iron-sulfur cluster binding domain-containing protein [Anaerolineales bacterium]|nr:MAG: 2Fe-2S iron-sulfur cluster binding domain-containing protein [Anaerolineales bacterium]
MSEVQITFNGKKVTAQSGQTILEAAQAAGVDIPVLCYHPDLSAWGACRMCMVEVKGMRGLQSSCTCPVADGMEIETESENAVEVRKFVLELLFSERNHYCMFCQMSGNCELQDAAYRYGLDHFMYPRPYDKLSVDASRKYFIMDHNRCILCTRCVRACDEIAANHTLNVRERGSESMIMADLNVPFGESTCVECGTCLQVCPTGALIDARSAYGGREKDVTHTQTTCMQCSVGCTLDVVTRYNRLLRVDGVFGSDPNGGLLCVDGRFAPLYDERKRVNQPLVRRDGKLAAAGWDEALDLVSSKLKEGSVEGFTTGATSNEALQAFSNLFEKAGSKAGMLEAEAPVLGFGSVGTISDIAEADFIVVAGADPLEYQRVIGYLIHRAADRGATVAVIAESENKLSPRADMTVSYADADKVAKAAADAEKIVLVYSVAIKGKVMAAFRPLADKLSYIALSPARNSQGAENVGLTQMKPNGATTQLFLMGEQAEDAGLLDKLNGAFTVVQASYMSPLAEKADVVLPAPLWYERTGHITNLEGKVLPLVAVLPMPEGVRDDAEVLEKLAEIL